MTQHEMRRQRRRFAPAPAADDLSASPDPAGGAARPPSAPRSVLDPGRLFLAAWALVAAAWTLTSESAYRDFTGSRKVTDDRAIVLTTVFVVVVYASARLGSRLAASGARRGVPSSVDAARALLTTRRGRTAVRATFAVPFAATAVLFLVVMSRTGGPLELARSVIEGDSLEALTRDVLTSPIWERVEALTHVFPVGAVLLAAAGVLRVGPSRRARRLMVASGFACSFGLSLLTSDRLIFYEHLIAYVVATVMLLRFLGRRIVTPRTAMRIVAVVVVVLGLWTVGEYARSYTSRFAGSGSAAPAPLEFAQRRLAAYYLTSFNNLQLLLSDPPEMTFPAESVPIAVTFFHAFEPQAEDALARRQEILDELYEESNTLTTFTLAGYLYQDAGPLGLVVMGAMLGYALGAVHARARWSLFCLLVYPVVTVAILDSLRIHYLLDTRGVITVVVAALVARSARLSPAPRSAPVLASTSW